MKVHLFRLFTIALQFSKNFDNDSDTGPGKRLTSHGVC